MHLRGTSTREESTRRPSARRPLRAVLLACMLVLLLAQALIGALSLSALNRLAADNTAQRAELLGRQTAAQIQTGLSLGKPLAQYFGLAGMLSALQETAPDLVGATVVMADGQRVAGAGSAMPVSALLDGLLGDDNQGNPPTTLRTSGAAQYVGPDAIAVAVPLQHPDGGIQGAVVVQLALERMQDSGMLRDNLWMLVFSTLGAALVLALIFRFAMPLHQLASAGKARLAVPLLVLLLAQGVYAAYTINTFRDVWVQVTQENTRLLGEDLQQDLQRLLAYGMAPDHWRGVEQPMSRLAAAFPVIGELRLLDAQGAVLNRANAQGVLDPDVPPVLDTDALVFPLRAKPQGPVQAQLKIVLDKDLIAAGVRERIMDAGTVVAVALVAAIELLLLLTLLMNRAFAVPVTTSDGERAGLDDPSEVGKVVRPVMFGFLFALALPLSFLPIYARSLLAHGAMDAGVPFFLALPISVEMGCGLLTALLAGRLTDRRGWQWPVLAGLLIAVAGNLACALAGSLVTFTLARGLVGLGYGLTWMGLQGFIVIRSPAAYRGRNMASVIAGLFAGHLSGAAVGAMLMEQLGPAAVFIAGAGLLVLPAVGVFTLMWPYRQQRGHKGPSIAAGHGVRSWHALRQLLATRDFGMLLAACVVPFSVAQVGLLTYALPLYMEAWGGTAAGTGRILMLYGLCVIYVGPYMGKRADRSPCKKCWIVGGGLVGSMGLLGLYFATGVMAAATAVVLLALASCMAGGAQAAYMLGLDNVQKYGAGGATSIMRGADKFGQMLGPLMVGGLFASIGMSGGLALTGAVYLVATLAFMIVAPRISLTARPASAPVP